ncbi:MAG: aldose 1-epimerase family protein [Bacteroidota bacterium]
MHIKLSNKKLTAEINSVGAELVSFSSGFTNYIWEVDDAFWNKTSPILFPIVGRLKNDTYQIVDKQYQLPRHGFARNFDFKILEKKEDYVVFSLNENQETFKSYPFAFELQVCYLLTEESLEIKYCVKNNTNDKMPFSLGAHPAFKINSNLEKYEIVFDNNSQLETHELENEQFSGKSRTINLKNNTLRLSYSLFEKDALVFKNIESRNLTFFENGNPYLKIHLGNFPHLGIWTKANAPFLCIEPWFGYADTSTSNGKLFEKEAIQILQPNEKFECSFTIEIL